MENMIFVLFGLKHSGKSTLGKLLAEKLCCNFYDTDDLIEKETGFSARELYAKKGAESFLSAEEGVCKKLSEKFSNEKIVIATGGGICDNPPAIYFLRDAYKFIFLKTDIELSVERICASIVVDDEGNLKNVPSFVLNTNPKSLDDVKLALSKIFSERVTRYESICDLCVDVNDNDKEKNLLKILDALEIESQYQKNKFI